MQRRQFLISALAGSLASWMAISVASAAERKIFGAATWCAHSRRYFGDMVSDLQSAGADHRFARRAVSEQGSRDLLSRFRQPKADCPEFPCAESKHPDRVPRQDRDISFGRRYGPRLDRGPGPVHLDQVRTA